MGPVWLACATSIAEGFAGLEGVNALRRNELPDLLSGRFRELAGVAHPVLRSIGCWNSEKR